MPPFKTWRYTGIFLVRKSTCGTGGSTLEGKLFTLLCQPEAHMSAFDPAYPRKHFWKTIDTKKGAWRILILQYSLFSYLDKNKNGNCRNQPTSSLYIKRTGMDYGSAILLYAFLVPWQLHNCILGVIQELRTVCDEDGSAPTMEMLHSSTLKIRGG